MRLRARTDANHAEIVRALRAVGASVQSLAAVGKGCPDLLVGFRQANYLGEVKDGSKQAARRKLNADQIDWHTFWHGQVAVWETPTDALRTIGAME